MKTVADLGVSTPQQNLRSQRLAILEYARAHDFRILETGDRLIVSELSRRGRSLGQVVTILDALATGAASPSWPSRRTSGSRASRTSGRGQDPRSSRCSPRSSAT